MSDKLEVKLEIKFFLDCPDDQKEKIKELLEDKGWFICQEIKLDKILKGIPNVTENGYEVSVVDLTNQ